jgi:hypothetical protein
MVIPAKAGIQPWRDGGSVDIVIPAKAGIQL